MNEIQKDHIDILKTMFFDYFAETAVSVSLLTPHASARNYFLLESENNKVIGVYGTSLSENKAFITIQKSFQKQGIRVPQVFAVHDSSFYY